MRRVDPDTILFDEEELEILKAYHEGRLEFHAPSEKLILAAQETLELLAHNNSAIIHKESPS